MNKIYQPTSTDDLSPHINVREFRCKCGGNHAIIVNTTLIEKLEQLMVVTGADIINISSANRCKQHDVNVGGNGYGKHTTGEAVDFQLVKNGTPIDSRVVAAWAKDIGFGGIGRINNTYTHCDVRESNFWYGDETIAGGTSGSVITAEGNYWDYYGLERPVLKPVETPKIESVEKRLQRALNSIDDSLNLDVDGILGKLSIGAIKKHNPLKESDSEYIKLVQELLNNKGYNCGTADGIVGDKTMQAVWSACVDITTKGD